MPLILQGATSGQTTIQATDATTQTITLPANSGTVLTSLSTQSQLPANIAGNGPAFSAYQGGSQTISAGTYAKLQINTKEFDTNTNFDSTTNYRFTPTISGYYQVNGALSVTSSAQGYITIYKNGVAFKGGNNITVNGVSVTVSALIYFNGSTDYIELYGYNSTSNAIITGAANTYFQASMVRGA